MKIFPPCYAILISGILWIYPRGTSRKRPTLGELFLVAIYFVEQTDYLFKENPSDDSYIVIGGTVESIDMSGNKMIIRAWQDENYKNAPYSEIESSKYLRFEYRQGNHEEWLHVVKEGNEWY